MYLRFDIHRIFDLIGLNLEQLLNKEKSCVELLNLVQKLGLGQCRLLGNYQLFNLIIH